MTNRFAALSAIDAGVGVAAPRPRAQNEQRSSAVAADHFGQRGPRAARRAVAVVPGVERSRAAAPAVTAPKMRPLQRVRERADGQLGDQPDAGRARARGESHRSGWRPGRGAVTRPEATPASMLPLIESTRGCASAASPRAARLPARRRGAAAPASAPATGSGIGSPASAGTPRASLAARYLGGSDRRGSRPPASVAARSMTSVSSSPLQGSRAGASSGRAILDGVPAAASRESSTMFTDNGAAMVDVRHGAWLAVYQPGSC